MDDTNLVQKQTVSDDPELAKVLAGVNAAAQTNNDDEDTELQYEGLEQEASAMPDNNINEIETEEIMAPNPVQSVSNLGGLNLDNIKISALQDLRPLVDKLNVSNEEKFDIYLLLLRSSDDNTLIQPAYEAARNIEDETKRANALLDVIKEIDYFNSKNIAA
jgi:bifunctional phosphoglucose/phosphomannose isomerase